MEEVNVARGTNAHVTWYIAFENARKPNFIQRFLKNGFQHCQAFRYDSKKDCWLFLEITREGLAVLLLDDRGLGFLLAQIFAKQGRALQIALPEDTKPVFRPFFNCATLAGAALGIKGALTPYRLYRILLSKGAKPAFTEILHEEQKTQGQKRRA
jgi:hypothetical protein